MQFLHKCGIIEFGSRKKAVKRRGFIILKLKLKSKIKDLTKESLITLKIMTLGLVLIIAILWVKYKPGYEVKIGDTTLGVISNVEDFNTRIKNEILEKKQENVDDISLEKEIQYETRLISRNVETNEENILNELANNYVVTTYKYYAVILNEKSKAYVDTIEEAEEVVNQIKSEYDGNDLELDLNITEVYTENKEEVSIENAQIAQRTLENEVEELIDEKEAREAIATINGVNLAVLPVSGTITSRFSDVSSIRSYHPHTGLDIACSTGTDIKAVAKGKVIFAGWDNTGLGNCIKIDHGNGIQTWYGHCSKIYVSVGNEISSGDVIAAVGSTGNSTGPHLHFEIRIDGKAVNPQIYVYNK